MSGPEVAEVPATGAPATGALVPVADPVAERAACAARVLEREGIPVVLALLDTRSGAAEQTDGSLVRTPSDAPAPGAPGAPAAASGAPPAVDGGDGPALAHLLDTYAAAIAPGAADDDVAALYSVVELIGYAHVRPPAPTPASTPPPLSEPVPTASWVGELGARTSFAAQRGAYAAGRVLRVANWHNTLPSAEDVLRAELTSYAERFTPIGVDDLDAFYATGRWPAGVAERPAFLPVFYDGYRNGSDVAARVCDELGLRALFLPPTAFLATPATAQREFADAHWIELDPEQDDEERLAMTLEELTALADRHDVGGHTATHQLAADITAEDVAREVTEPIRVITERCGRSPAAWAFLGGTPFDVALPAWRAVRDAGVRYAVSNTSIERIA